MQVRGAFCLLALLCASALTAPAAVMQKLYLDDLVGESQVIVHATVTGARAHWDADHRYIYTTYTAQTAQYVKGFLGETFEFRQPGGMVDGQGLFVPGAPHFKAGQEVVLFLWTDGPSGAYQVNGLAQGVLNVLELNGAKYVDRQIPDRDNAMVANGFSIRLAADRTLSGTLATIGSRVSQLEQAAARKEGR